MDNLRDIFISYGRADSKEFAMKLSQRLLSANVTVWLDVDDMQERIVANVPGVTGIHHVHVWGLTPQQLMLTMHVTIADDVESQSTVVAGVKNVVRDEFGIGHSTIEVDVDGCSDAGECC